nr:integrase, catalytic region, zinc finger, CCHC-type, peptidase aspartic, catalytic [Tanacetum cinerariifolium]
MSMPNSQQDALVVGSDARPPIVYRGNYVQWSSSDEGKMKNQEEEDLSDKELARYEADIKLKNIMMYGLRNDIYASIDSNQTSKELWDALKRT